MRISEILSEGPLQAVGRAVGKTAGGALNTVGQATGVAAGVVPAAANAAAKGFKSGYDKMDKALKGIGKPSAPDKDASSINREELMNRVLAGQTLNFSDVEKCKTLLKGLNDGTVKTNQNPTLLAKALNAAANGQPVPANLRSVIEAFRDEA